MRHVRRLALVGACAIHLLPAGAGAQGVDRVRESLLSEVMPDADRIGAAAGSPLVRRAYRGDELIGYVFLTSDLPPEERGYSGPIEALVGMRPDGTLTGVRVVRYRETYMSTRGDFLRTPGFQEQFAGKYIGDAFRVYQDVDGISRVTISIRALARGVRKTAREVAAEYFRAPERAAGPVEDLTSLPWFEMRRAGVAQRFEVTEEGRDPVGVSLIHLESAELAEYLIGGLYRYALQAAERRGGADHLMLYVVDGTRPRIDIQQGWSVTQDGMRFDVPVENVAMLGAPWEGLLFGETSMVGVLLLDGPLDVARPMTFVYDRGPDLGSYTLEYTTQRALVAMAEAAEAEEAAAAEAAAAEAAAAAAVSASVADAENGGAPDAGAAEPSPDPSPEAGVTEPVDPSPPEPSLATLAPAPSAAQLDMLDFTLVREETALERMLANASWSRVAWIGLALCMATIAFFTKLPTFRWLALGTTLIVLGYVDGGFLSVSHITSAIWVGPSVFLNDLPLLIMVVFTLLTLVLWGRIFCGFLCPFGALQDFIDRVVPKRLQRELPKGAHRIGLKAKYAILAIIVVPALAGSQASLYQYFEPFGTVFTVSASGLLWSIAGAILIASAVIPRFYCRYACPLGAALAIGSLVSLRRIPRVEQCDYCKVCEHKCPTGAIDGPDLDFKECVRCNVCEMELIAKSGVCRHDMEAIRPRLVQLEPRGAVGLSDVVSAS